jgi:hypothetical protein
MIREAGFILTLFSDRFRGKDKVGGFFGMQQVKRAIEALGIVACAGFPLNWWFPGAVACLWLGTTLGYGNVIGPAATGGRVSRYKGMLGPSDPGPETPWQIGILQDNVWLALIVFGALWSLPITVYSYFAYKPGMWLMPIAMLAFPLSCAIGRFCQSRFGFEGWMSQQLAFGPIMAVTTILL